jgi:hypothetical protein
MRLKGIASFIALAVALFPAAALDERIELTPAAGVVRLPGPGSSIPGSPAVVPPGTAAVRDPILGGWLTDNAVAVTGFRGGTDFVLAPAAYGVGADTDLLLHFDGGTLRDETGRWTVSAGRSFASDLAKSAIGRGSASFRGPSTALSLMPGRGSLFDRSSRFRDFSIEFWLYPSSVENGELVLSWQSQRPLAKGSMPQAITCSVSGGRLAWTFQGFFDKPGATSPSATRVEVRAAAPLVPKAWSHHLIRFDGDSGLLEYLVNGVTEGTAYATSSGHEGGAAAHAGAVDVWAPAVGATAALVLGADYSGLMDEFRISRSFIEGPTLAPYGRDPGLLLSPVADLGFGNSRLLSVDVVSRTPGNTGIELSYRISDEWIGWNLESPAWRPLRAGEALPADARGRYVQVRVDLYPDGTGRQTPSLSSVTLHYEPDPPPPAPAQVLALPKDGGVELRWSRVPEADVAGYLVWYGSSPGEYYGSNAAEGASPIDVGNVLSFTVTGLPNGGLVYFAVAAYDKAALPGMPARRAGPFSPETQARPSRTAR